MLYTKYQGPRPCGFRPEDFQSFHLEIFFNLCDIDYKITKAKSSPSQQALNIKTTLYLRQRRRNHGKSTLVVRSFTSSA